MSNAGRRRFSGGWWLLGALLFVGALRADVAFKGGQGVAVAVGLVIAVFLGGAIVGVTAWFTARASDRARALFGPNAVRCVAHMPRQRSAFFVVDDNGASIRTSHGKIIGQWPFAGLEVFRDVVIPWSRVVSRPGLMLNTRPSVFLLFVSPSGLRCPPELLDAVVGQLVNHGVPVQQVGSGGHEKGQGKHAPNR